MKRVSVLRRRTALVVSLCAAVAACGDGAAPDAANAANTAAAKADVVADNVDTSVDPGTDFFTFANGTWLKRHPLPASEPSWGIGRAVREELYGTLRKISEDAAAKKDAAAGSDEQKIGDFWSTAMDEQLAERAGLSPIREQLAAIDAVKDVDSALDVAFSLLPLGADVLFGFYIVQDEKASDVMAVHLYQGGLGLPERDYYFNKEEGIAQARAAYVKHLHNVLVELGSDDAAASDGAAKIMAFETALAQVSRPIEALRDPQRNYN
jgi:putative endopeptidase